MSATRIDGKAIAADVRAEVRRGAERFTAAAGRPPGLAVVLVGDDPASAVYVRNKDRAAHDVGFHVRTLRRPATFAPADLIALVHELGRDRDVDGILVQLPLPAPHDGASVVRAIAPEKDVDGLHPVNVAALWMGEPGLVSCTPAGCLELLDRSEVRLEGAKAVIVGRSLLVGKPMAALLLGRNATVTIAHSRTRDLADVCRGADVLVAAVGRAGLVQGDWIRPGAAVIDVGINRRADGTLVGDVDYEGAVERAGLITPVPGGVGPMTIAMLLRNTLIAAVRARGWNEREFLHEG